MVFPSIQHKLSYQTSHLSHGIRPFRRNKRKPEPDHKYHQIHRTVDTLFHILDAKKFLCTLSFRLQFAQVQLFVLVSKGFKVFASESQLLVLAIFKARYDYIL